MGKLGTVKKIFISEDHPLMREALIGFLSKREDLKIVDTATTCKETLSGVKKYKPDLIILDILLLDGSATLIIKDLLAASPESKILVYSCLNDTARVREALRLGVSGYLTKETPKNDLLEAIDLVLLGKQYLSQKYQHLLGESTRSRLKKRETGNNPLVLLSHREKQVFNLITEGQPNREIAKELSISSRTVETHRSRILKKLSITSNAELVKLSMRVDA